MANDQVIVDQVAVIRTQNENWGIVRFFDGNFVNTVWGDGSGSLNFCPSEPYDTSLGRWLAGDWNGDGKTDLIHITGLNYVHSWLSNGDGNFALITFTPSAAYDTSLGRWLAGDWNGDGKTDLIHITGLNYVHSWLSNGDGNFALITFTPSAAYDTSLGRWLAGDWNGDGKTDLIHITGLNYVHSWLSNGDGNFALITFTPSAAYDTSLGQWLAGDWNGDGKTDLIHITGLNYVHSWLSNGDGNFALITFTPSAAYDTSLGQWLAGDWNGDGRTDLIHITGLDYVHPWFSNGDGKFSVPSFAPGYDISKGIWLTTESNDGDSRTLLLHIVQGDIRVWKFDNASGSFKIDVIPLGNEVIRVAKSSGQQWSGEKDEWSQWYELASDDCPAGYVIGAASFQLGGDRRCGSWANCEQIQKSPSKVAWRFQMQGHNEGHPAQYTAHETRNPQGEVIFVGYEWQQATDKATSIGLLSVVMRKT